MLNYKEIKFHHDNTVQNCLNGIYGIACCGIGGTDEDDQTAREFHEALDIWHKYKCGLPGTSQEDTALGLAALSNAYAKMTGRTGEEREELRSCIETLRHKLLPHTVDEEAMRGARLSTRTGICPVCGQPVSTVLSQERCYYCDSRLAWK